MSDKRKNISDLAMDRRVDQDRKIVEARMLTNKRKLTKLEHNSVRNRLHALMERTQGTDSEVTMAMIARDVIYKASTLSLWLHDNYKGKNDLVTHAVNAWLERHHRRETGKTRGQYVRTWVAERMIAYARTAHRQERMLAVAAPSGSGKDIVIDFLMEELGGYLIHCHEKMTAAMLVQTIADEIHITDQRTSCARTINKIVKKLKGRTCTIILNEAQNLPDDTAGIIRTIYDQTSVPILMFGSAGIFDFIDDSKVTTRRSSGGGQFWRRCKKLNLVEHMQRVGDPDDPEKLGRPLFTKDEIREFVRMKQIKLAGNDELEMLWRVSCLIDRGTLGLVAVVLDGIADLWPDETITIDHIATQLFEESGGDADLILEEAERLEVAAA